MSDFDDFCSKYIDPDGLAKMKEEGIESLEDLKECVDDPGFPYQDFGIKYMKWNKMKKALVKSSKPEETVEPLQTPDKQATKVEDNQDNVQMDKALSEPVVQDVRTTQLNKLKKFYALYNPTKVDNIENMNKILDEYATDYPTMWKHLEQKYILGAKSGGQRKKAHLDKKPISKAEAILEGIARLYTANIRELEAKYKFPDFHSPLMDAVDFKAKPIVLLVGQYSVGKTSFIKYLLERDFPGSRIGPEPTTDSFMAVMHGQSEKVIPGNAAVMDRDMPFRTLQRFGIQFLNKFSVSQMNAPILESISFLDTPGILSGEKQRLGRHYDFAKVVEQFAHRADRVLLLFDAHKLDISDEFRGALEMLKGHDDKVRCILNKADQVPNQQLLRVYGALMWSLGKVFKTPEVLRVYVGSFWDNPYEQDHNADLFDLEAQDLLADLKSLPRHRVTRKINEFVKRTRQFKVHLLVMQHLKAQFGMFSGDSQQKKVLNNMASHFKQVAESKGLTLADFPNPNKFAQIISNHKIKEFPKIKDKYLLSIDHVLNQEVPRLMKLLPGENEGMGTRGQKSSGSNPFANRELDEANLDPSTRWVVDAASKKTWDNKFFSLELSQGEASGAQLRPVLQQSGLSEQVLMQIWNLADITKNGKLDADEFALAMWLIDYVNEGSSLPPGLKMSMVPPSKRRFVEFK